MTPALSPYQVAVRAGLPMSVPQAAKLKAFAGEPLNREEQRAWRTMTGTWFASPNPDGYDELWDTDGRRSGKDTRTLAPIAVSTALNPKYEKNGAPGERFVTLVTAPIVEKTTQLMNSIRGLFDRIGVKYQTRDGWLVLEDRPVDVRPVPMTAIAASSDSAKGIFATDMAKGSVVEGSLRHDATFVASSKAMLLSTGGVFVSASQAWMRDGAHYDTCEKFWKKTDGRILVTRGPTWFWVPEHTREMCMELAGGDPRTFKREYEAVPGHADDALLDVDDIERCIARGVTERSWKPRFKYAGAIDLAFRHDFSALCIGHRETTRLPDGSARDITYEDALLTWKPTRGRALDPEGVIAEMAAELRRWKIRTVAIDQYSYDLASSRFAHHGIKTELLKSDVPSQARRAELFMSKLRSGTISLLDDADANRELARLRMQLRSNGMISFAAPATRSDHDDRSDARFALVERLQTVAVVEPDVKEEISVSIEPGVGPHIRISRYRETKWGRVPVAPPRGSAAWDSWCKSQIIEHGVVGGGSVEEWLTEQNGGSAVTAERRAELIARVRAEWNAVDPNASDVFVGVTGDGGGTLDDRLGDLPAWKTRF